MKKYLVLLILTMVLCFWATGQGQYGEFGDGTASQDTVPIFFQAWDSLGFAAPADTVWIWRYIFGTTVVDSTVDTSPAQGKSFSACQPSPCAESAQRRLNP